MSSQTYDTAEQPMKQPVRSFPAERKSTWLKPTSYSVVAVALIAAVLGSTAWATMKVRDQFDSYVQAQVDSKYQVRLDQEKAQLAKQIVVGNDYAVMTAIWTAPNSKSPVLKTMSVPLEKCQELKDANAKAAADYSGNSLVMVNCDAVTQLFGTNPATNQ